MLNIKVRGAFKERIFVCPADEHSNASIVKDPSMIHEEPLLNANCFFGKNKVRLSVYPVSNIFYKKLETSRLAFYAFKQKTKDGNLQYFDSRNLRKKPDNALAIKLAKLLEKLPKEKAVEIK